MTTTVAESVTTPVVTPITRKRPSAATRKAAASKPAPAKRTSGTPTTPAKKKVTPKPAVPSLRTYQHQLGTALISAAAKLTESYKIPAGSPMTREDIASQLGKWMSYVPGEWDTRMPMTSAGGRRSA